MKKIGFIDYFLDEWHANNYPAWIRDPVRNLLPDGTKRFEITMAWAAKDREGGLTTRQWCVRNGVTQADSIEALVAECDCLIVLSPDNPEQHEALARIALLSGKPTYVDKTFAPDKAAAERMFALADQSGTPLYSTSALRYARELAQLRDAGLSQNSVTLAATRGPGILANYGVHQIEMIAAAMGCGAERVLMQGPVETPTFLFGYSEGRTATVQHLPWAGFSLLVHGVPDPKTGEGIVAGMQLDIASDFWGPFTDSLLRFFDTGVPEVPKRETLEVIAMIEAGGKAMRQPGVWIMI